MKFRKNFYDYIPKLIISSLMFLILGFICFYCGCSNLLTNFFTNEDVIVTWKNVFCSIGSVLIISGIYNVIYEYSIRNSMFNVIRKELGIKDFIVSAGIDSIWLQLNDIPYKSLFRDIQSEVDILHAYGNSWNDTNFDYIKDLLKRNKNITIRVILLSPKSKLLDGLYELYRKKSLDDLHRSMYKSIEDWLELAEIANEKHNNIKIYYHNQNPTHSLYRFDDKIVNVSNLIPKTKTTKLPTIICKKNDKYTDTLYSNYYEEIECVIKHHSIEVTKENYKDFFSNNKHFYEVESSVQNDGSTTNP